MDKELITKLLTWLCEKNYAGFKVEGTAPWFRSPGDWDTKTIEEVAEEFEKDQFFKQARSKNV